jgi:hypothetical protein
VLFQDYLQFYLITEPRVIASLPEVLKKEVGISFWDEKGQHHTFRIQEIVAQYRNKMPLVVRSTQTGEIVQAGFMDHPILEEAPLRTDPDGRQYRDLTPWLEKYLPEYMKQGK